jgi:hypothetical protein
MTEADDLFDRGARLPARSRCVGGVCSRNIVVVFMLATPLS